VGARLRVSTPETGLPGAGGADAPASSRLGMAALVSYRWEIALGDTTLSLEEFEQLATRKSPLIRVNGRWVEVRPEDVQAAMRFVRESSSGTMTVAEALRVAYGSDPAETGVPIVGLELEGWLKSALGGDSEQLPILDAPDAFKGTLRPYQARGLSWMSFLERFGFGMCLADDMGLGKTIQLLALLLEERKNGETPAPTLLVVPMSVVSNWVREAKRFAPDIRVMLHHGVARLIGDALQDEVAKSDLVVTTYALAHRDHETIAKIPWGRIVLDEAQCIKNPLAKQSQAVRSIVADRRVALTGTPVENRLSELWSIMDFLNPGLLGSSQSFRKRFAVPIERYRDRVRTEQLRRLVQPFILRRLKTDPGVVADLPPKLETKEYSHLTAEQAQLYDNCVKRMLTEVDRSEGMQRRGLVLAALIKLKQICNHPAQLLKDTDGLRAPDPARSGKTTRLLEMLDEVLAEGDQALIFTQFRQMGHLLQLTLQQELDRQVLFLHGGTPQTERQRIIDTFQRADGQHPILILSLKAGGVGLNLTAATHVFHYDRWWNPAVENQATDRAYRIGQTRTVHVHKFIVAGTLEERIDEMIEQKTELASNIIGSGERWLTELSTDQLREIFTLRPDAIAEEVS
jgi:SNF2 family DNA or RNA helicase